MRVLCKQPMAWLGLALLGMVVSGLVLSAAAHEPKKIPDEKIYKATPMPDRIILTWKGDPATSQAVTWRTDTSVEKGFAQIAVAEVNRKFETKATMHEATTEFLKADLCEAHFHSVNFEGLTPKTKYVYRVGDGVNWSEWIHFNTASSEPEPFSFIYFGDAQNDVKAHWSRVIREAYSDAPKASFIIHAGDLINRANRDAEWGEWFHAGGWLNSMVPSIPTPGNHEYFRYEGNRDKSLSTHWRPTFTLPDHGPSGLDESVYYIDYQGVRIVSLNSNEKQNEQVKWLDEVLGNNPNKWTVLTFHHPIYAAARGRDNPFHRARWQPVFDKYKVDLCLTGHDHTYGRSGLLTFQKPMPKDAVPDKNVGTGANVRDPKSGTVYVVSVSGPKMYMGNDMKWKKKSAEFTQLYQIIHVNGDSLKYEARTVLGDLYDAFELKKRPGMVNEMIEIDVKTAAKKPLIAPAEKSSAGQE